MKRLDYIIETAITKLIEQETPPAGGDAGAAGKKKETDNAPSDAEVSPFTPAEEKFLGKFDAYGTTHLGIIYSPTDIGIREFLGRSGNDLNCTPGILLKLLRNKIIKIVPYTGFGRNTDYTIELQLSLDDVKGLGAADKDKAEAGSSAAGAPAGGAPAAPENAGYVPKGNLISERRKYIHEQLTLLITEETSTSAAKKYLLSKDKDIVSKINLAARFWKGMIAVGYTDIGWDENHYVATFNNVLFNHTKFSGRERAIYIDSLGSILRLARQEDAAAVTFLTDFIDYEFDVTLNINKLGRYQSSIAGMLTPAQLDWIVEELDNPQEFLDKFNNKGIGKVIMKPKPWYGQSFFPAYSENEVNAQVLRWLAPYKSTTTTDKAGHEKIKKVKAPTFYDTLTPEQRQQRAKWALSQINSNIRKYFSSATKANVKKTLPKIQDMSAFGGAWVDKEGYGFAYIKYKGGSVGRLYPSGKYVLVSSKGKVERTRKWEINYSKSTGQFWVSEKM